MNKLTQHERLHNLLSDGRPHRTDEIVEVVYPSANFCIHCGRGDRKSLARVGARIWDLKNGKWRGKVKCGITGWKDRERHDLHWYRMELVRTESATVKLRSFVPPAFAPKKVEANQKLFA